MESIVPLFELELTMNRIEKIDHKIKRNYQLVVYSWFVGVMAGTVFLTWFLIWFAKGTINFLIQIQW